MAVTTWRDRVAFGTVQMRPQPLASLGAANTVNQGTMAYTTDGIAGNPGAVISNGTNWVYLHDNATTAATTP